MTARLYIGTGDTKLPFLARIGDPKLPKLAIKRQQTLFIGTGDTKLPFLAKMGDPKLPKLANNLMTGKFGDTKLPILCAQSCQNWQN